MNQQRRERQESGAMREKLRKQRRPDQQEVICDNNHTVHSSCKINNEVMNGYIVHTTIILTLSHYKRCTYAGEDIESLKSLILARKNSREAQMDGFFDSLEEKYAKKPRKGGSKKEQNGGSKGAAGGSARSKGAGGRSSRAKKGGV